jgi:hypothetical protein
LALFVSFLGVKFGHQILEQICDVTLATPQNLKLEKFRASIGLCFLDALADAEKPVVPISSQSWR